MKKLTDEQQTKVNTMYNTLGKTHVYVILTSASNTQDFDDNPEKYDVAYAVKNIVAEYEKEDSDGRTYKINKMVNQPGQNSFPGGTVSIDDIKAMVLYDIEETADILEETAFRKLREESGLEEKRFYIKSRYIDTEFLKTNENQYTYALVHLGKDFDKIIEDANKNISYKVDVKDTELSFITKCKAHEIYDKVSPHNKLDKKALEELKKLEESDQLKNVKNSELKSEWFPNIACHIRTKQIKKYKDDVKIDDVKRDLTQLKTMSKKMYILLDCKKREYKRKYEEIEDMKLLSTLSMQNEKNITALSNHEKILPLINEVITDCEKRYNDCDDKIKKLELYITLKEWYIEFQKAESIFIEGDNKGKNQIENETYTSVVGTSKVTAELIGEYYEKVCEKEDSLRKDNLKQREDISKHKEKYEKLSIDIDTMKTSIKEEEIRNFIRDINNDINHFVNSRYDKFINDNAKEIHKLTVPQTTSFVKKIHDERFENKLRGNENTI